MKLKGKVSIVTGGARGIGKAIASRLAEEGSDIAIVDLDDGLLKTTTQGLAAQGYRVLPVKADISSWKEVERTTRMVLKEFHKIDVLVNNAGIYSETSIEEMTESEWDRVLDINLKGAFLCSKAVLPHMKQRRQGVIINIASNAGKTGGIVVGDNYSCSKAGVICLTRSLAKKYGQFGIRVNAVAPGPTDPASTMISHWTPERQKEILSLIPLGRFAQTEDVANAVAFLASDEASYITGEIMDVNGGLLID